MNGDTILNVRGLTVRFGTLVAVSDVSFDAQRGHITSVIGPNGAGKSSLLNCVSGLYHPQKGKAVLHTGDGAITHELTKLPPHRIARLGVARSF